MAQLEYRTRDNGGTAWTNWESVTEGLSLRLNSSLPHLADLEVRIKPDFVPGYYRATAYGNSGIVWFESASALQYYARDERLLPEDFERVNVTPAE
jgi:hypothetical protein